jgi:hypothetical protein
MRDGMVGTAVKWWRRWSAEPGKVARRRRTGVMALVVVVGCIVVAKLLWGTTGPGIATPFAFFVLFVAAVTLLAVTIIHSEELVDELEASHPPRVRNRGGLARTIAALDRVLVAWLSRAGPALRREMRRDSLVRRSRALADALSGIPPSGVSLANAGPLARPAARRPSAPVRIGAHHRTARQTHSAHGQALATLDQLRRQRRRRREERIRPREGRVVGSTKPATKRHNASVRRKTLEKV